MKRAACSLAILLAAGVMVSGCQSTPKGPKPEQLAFIYVDCVKEANDGKAVPFEATASTAEGFAFESFVPKEELSEEQTAQIKACYEAKVAAFAG